jgi:hypothetical protein
MRFEAGAAALFVAAAATFIGVGPTSAQEGDPPKEPPEPTEPLEVSPTSGPPGTVISIQGVNCISTATGSPAAIVNIELVGESGQASTSVAHFDVDDDTGAWSTQLAVPAGADPDDTFVLTAVCAALGPEDNHIFVFEYLPVDFDVTAPPAPTTPPPTPTAPPAPPAQPIPGDPTFTG